ncbi:MAG: hypothetical protein HFI50_06875 [Lachnospiraceae bacterium]|nr:hypothetical protein [Lachnospiraceae bacterium]
MSIKTNSAILSDGSNRMEKNKSGMSVAEDAAAAESTEMGGYCLEDIPDGSVRIEELLNYFQYDYVRPEKDEPFGVTAQIADCPRNPNSKIEQNGENRG